MLSCDVSDKKLRWLKSIRRIRIFVATYAPPLEDLAADIFFTRDNSAERRQRFVARLCWAGVAAGAGLRLWQFAAGPAMWLDELAIARNVTQRSLTDLMTRPLSWDQSAPKGFLALEKLSTLAFGANDYALRLFPFLCSLLALWCFAAAARRIFSGLGAPVAIALFAFAGPLIDYGSRVKPYTVDLAAAAVLLLVVLDLQSAAVTPRKAHRAGAAGACAVCVSQIAPLLLGSLAACLCVPALRAWRAGRAADRAQLKALGLLAAWWFIALFAALAAFRGMTRATTDFLHDYWAEGFPPSSLAGEMRTFWPFGELLNLLGRGAPACLAYPAPWFYLALACCGLAALLRMRREAGLAVAAPLFAALAAAAAGQYPFSDRLILFLYPVLFLCLAAGMSWLAGKFPGAALLAVLPALLGLSPTLQTLPPYQIEDVKPLLSYLRENWRPGDRLYADYGAGPPMMFYGRSYGFAEKDYLQGGCHRGAGAWRDYLRAVDRLRGRPRVWVLIAHVEPPYGEGATLKAYLDRIGIGSLDMKVFLRTVSSKGDYAPAELLLYDLSVPGRLGQAGADAFSFVGREDDRTCTQGPLSMVRERLD
jgi:hypothetical protein